LAGFGPAGDLPRTNSWIRNEGGVTLHAAVEVC